MPQRSPSRLGSSYIDKKSVWFWIEASVCGISQRTNLGYQVEGKRNSLLQLTLELHYALRHLASYRARTCPGIHAHSMQLLKQGTQSLESARLKP